MTGITNYKVGILELGPAEEVEAALLELEGVEEAVAFDVPDGEGSRSLRAAVVVAAETPERGRLPDGDAFRGYTVR